MPTQQCIWLNDQERLPPCPNHPGQEHEKDTISFRTCWSFHLPLEYDELLPQERVFRHKLRLASAKVSEGFKRQ